jgi:hypothetical protein
MQKTIFRIGSVAALLLFVVACSKMDAYKDEFLAGGEIQYTGKADSVKFHSGYNRVQLSWLILSDPKVSRAKVYWNYRRDSAEITINRTKNVDTVRLLIRNLPEGTYDFEIFTYDKAGHTSIPSPINGKVYGERYEATLLPRGVDNSNSWTEEMEDPNYHQAIISWRAYSATDGVIGMELTYTDEDDQEQTVVTPAKEPQSLLPKYQPGSDIHFRTLYQPDSLAIDTFYTRPVKLKFD